MAIVPRFCTSSEHIGAQTTTTRTTEAEADSSSSMSLDSELIESAKSGNLDQVHDLLKRGANVNAKNEGGWTALVKHGGTPLILASFYGHVEVVCELLNHDGVKVNNQSRDGDTALICASENGHLDVVRALLNRGVAVNIMNQYARTALDVARDGEHDDVANLLMEHMEREKHRKEEEQKRREDAERMQALEKELERQRKDAERMQTDKNPFSDDSSVEVVHELLQNNEEDVTAQFTDGATPLYLASENGHVAVVQALLENNEEDVTARFFDGATALYLASENGHVGSRPGVA